MSEFKGFNNIFLNVDIKKKNYYNIECNQNDDIHLVIYLFENGQVLNLDDTKDTYTIKYVNANNTITNSDLFGGGHSNNNNILSIYFPRNCTLSSGLAHMQVTLVKKDDNVDNKQTSTFPINIKITPSVIQGQEVSKNATNLVKELDDANLKGQEVINNIKDAEIKYPSTSQLYKDVQNLKEIGVRNLFKYSRDFSKYWTSSNATLTKNDGSPNSNYRGLTIYTTDKNWGSFRQSVYLEQGKTYTLGVYLKCNVSDVQVNYYCTIDSDSSKNYGGLVTNSVSLNEWKRYSVTFTAETTENTLIRVEPTNVEDKSGLLEVCGYTLVEGSYIPQDYFDAIEDDYRKQLYDTDDILLEGEGKYQGICANSPNTINNWLYDVKEYSGNSKYKRVIAYNVSNNIIVQNTCNNGTWIGWKNIELQAYPVGSIKLTTNNTNPSEYLMGSTWSLVGQGRNLVGVGTGTDSNSNTKTFSQGNNEGQYSATNIHNHGFIGVSTVTNVSGGYVVGNSNHTDDASITIDTVNPSYGVYIWLRTA